MRRYFCGLIHVSDHPLPGGDLGLCLGRHIVVVSPGVLAEAHPDCPRRAWCALLAHELAHWFTRSERAADWCMWLVAALLGVYRNTDGEGGG